MYLMDEMMQWLQNWAYSNYKKNQMVKVLITTIDNPGWGITVDLGNNFQKKLPLADVEKSENNWYYCTIKNNKFEGDGGLFNLNDIFSTFKFSISNAKEQSKMSDDLIWLMQWFANQCNGDWEHEYGVRIGTLDNPGWRLRVSLLGTELECKEFERVAIERSENDWLFCFIEEGHFEGAGGLYNLPETLKIFRNWAES